MIENNINNYVSIAIFLLYNKMLSGQKKKKKLKMVLEMKLQVKRDPNDGTVRCKKVIVRRHCYYKGKIIYSGTCSL